MKRPLLLFKDSKQSEYGSFRITLDDKGRSDDLFSKMPKSFFVQQGHEDYVVTLPKNARVLATNNNGSIEAARFSSTTIGMHFHPEMNIKDMLIRYRLVFKPDLRAVNNFRKLLRRSPASKILYNIILPPK